ncbi:MAG TPA: T9SS type A sorting domain-containing protein [Ferruginibacter sp.]|nr:T9SS type A sorting domain-containing protein [Ferruginibacter sp.]
MNKTFILWVLLLLACTSISQAQTAGTPTSYGSSTSVGTAPTIPSITDSTIIKIPIDGSRWYQLDNVSNGLQALFDGDTVTSVSTGYGKLLTNFDAYYPVADDEAMDIYKIKFYDGSGTITATPMTLYAIDNKGVKTLLGTFTGSQYNEWVGPNGNTQYSLGTPIRNVRYLVLNSSSAYPTEMQIYGTYRSGAGASAATPKPVKLSQMFGVNAFEWNFLDPNNPGTINESEMTAGRSFTQIRHYLDWGRIEPTKGGYTFSPSHNGGWDYDALYTRLNKEGIEVLADIKTLPQWLLNTYPADQQDAENVPVPYGSDFSDPNSYILQAKVAFQFAARYGSNKSVNTSLQSVDGSQRWANDPANVVKTGLGLIRYIECDNERDKWWKGRKAYQTAYEYAANLSAFYDGNKNTMGPGVGVKNADPNMQVVMCGTALATPDYIKGMVDWCKLHRGYKADGTVNLCWDVINYHLYSNNAGTSQGGNSTAGAAPEGSGAAGTAQDFINVAHQYIQNMPVWVTELGYDINQGSPLKAIPIGSKTAAQTQADWSLRSALLYARAGVQRIFFYEMYDDNPTSTVQFASSGLINADNSRRPVADYLYQTNKLLGAYTYSNTISTNPYVDIYTLNGKNAYVLAMPTQNGSTKSYNLDLNQADSAMIYTPAIGQDSMSVQKVKTSSGKLSLTVTETPMFVIPYGTLAKDTTPVVKDSTPVVVTPPVVDSTPVVVTPPVVKDSTPVVVTPPVVDSTPVVVTPPVVKDSTPVVVTPPVVDSTPVVVTPPVVKDTTNGGGASQGYLSTDTSSTAKDSAIDTEPLAFNVYPNPAQSYINITYTDNYVGNVTFILYSASGHIAKIERVYKSAETITEQIDISTLRNGVYMLQLKSNSYEVLTRKVIKIS